MSEKSQLVLMAAYNRLMNRRMLKAAENLSRESLAADRGAFFKSVIGTMNHIMVGDILWLKRFSFHPGACAALQSIKEIKQPESLAAILFSDPASFKQERSRLDNIIIEWCNEVRESDLAIPLEYTNVKGEMHNKRLGDLILHLFLHQIHHRGQVTTLLSQENIDFGETDLIEIVPEAS